MQAVSLPLKRESTSRIERDFNSVVTKALLKAVSRSTHKRYQTGCVIVKKNIIFSDGCAHASHIRMNDAHSIHAEIHALGRGRHESLTNATAYIATVARKSGNFVFSAPCLTCAIALRSAGVMEAIYSTPEGFKQMNLEDDLSELKIYPRRIK